MFVVVVLLVCVVCVVVLLVSSVLVVRVFVLVFVWLRNVWWLVCGWVVGVLMWVLVEGGVLGSWVMV